MRKKWQALYSYNGAFKPIDPSKPYYSTKREATAVAKLIVDNDLIGGVMTIVCEYKDTETFTGKRKAREPESCPQSEGVRRLARELGRLLLPPRY